MTAGRDNSFSKGATKNLCFIYFKAESPFFKTALNDTVRRKSNKLPSLTQNKT